MELDRATFDALQASADAAMVVVTTFDGRERAGCLVGFHGQSSIAPPRYSVWLSKANHTYPVALRARELAVHYLTADDLELAELFGATTGDDIDKFSRCGPVVDHEGVPLIEALPNRFVGWRTTVLDEGGDHVCVVLAPLLVERSGPFTPLRLSQVAHLHPGHEATERATDR